MEATQLFDELFVSAEVKTAASRTTLHTRTLAPSFRAFRLLIEIRLMNTLFLIALMATLSVVADEPEFAAEQIFPPVEPQTHAPGIVECSNGDLLASWYGDERPHDSAVVGARKRRGQEAWDAPFVMADRPGFPDCNTAMNIDGRGRLWLFWPTIVGGSWESALLNYQVASDYAQPGPPKWDRSGVILLKPDDFSAEALRLLGTRDLHRPGVPSWGQGAKRRNWPIHSINAWGGPSVANRRFCRAAGSCCRFIPIRFRFRSWH